MKKLEMSAVQLIVRVDRVSSVNRFTFIHVTKNSKMIRNMEIWKYNLKCRIPPDTLFA